MLLLKWSKLLWFQNSNLIDPMQKGFKSKLLKLSTRFSFISITQWFVITTTKSKDIKTHAHFLTTKYDFIYICSTRHQSEIIQLSSEKTKLFSSKQMRWSICEYWTLNTVFNLRLTLMIFNISVLNDSFYFFLQTNWILSVDILETSLYK